MVTTTLSNLTLDMPQAGDVECDFVIRSDHVEVSFVRSRNADGVGWRGASMVKYEFSASRGYVRVVRRTWSVAGETEVAQWDDRLPGMPEPDGRPDGREEP